MSPVIATFWTTPATFGEWVKFFAIVIVTLAGLGALAVIFLNGYLNRWRTRRRRILLETDLGAEFYSPEIIELALRYYVPPSCHNFDPEEEDNLNKVSKPLFETIDTVLTDPAGYRYRYIFLLADSGMGKTAFLINYYARNISRRWRRKKFNLALLPLGIPDADERIRNIPEPSTTVLLLDAFEEDPFAIEDRGKRLKEVLELTRNFKKVLITLDTRFFSMDHKSAPGGGLVRISGSPVPESVEHDSQRIYLSPLNDANVVEYLKKRYPFWRWQRRRQAEEIVAKMPNPTLRPMLLTYIDDLIEQKATARNSYELYDQIVEAWLRREGGILKVEKEKLRRFSEQLAVYTWHNREHRRTERIIGEELAELASIAEVPLHNQEPRSRSLLHRDSSGNYQFAHRSIMEFLFLKRFLNGDKHTHNIPWSERMQAFLSELVQMRRSQGELLPSGLAEADLSLYPLQLPLTLRYQPKRLEETEIQKMLEKYDFFEAKKHTEGKGLTHDYHAYSKGKDKVVIDYTTNLMWQQGGSSSKMRYADAEQYIRKLNYEQFAGYRNWRLPTLEEAMSLLESREVNGDLYIALIFDRTQRWIWTADSYWATNTWSLFFHSGICYGLDLNDNRYVRAVRSPV